MLELVPDERSKFRPVQMSLNKTSWIMNAQQVIV